MPGGLSKSLHSSSHLMKNMKQQAKVTEKQGIVAILGSDVCERTKAASLRRTLSADMSSKKWLAQQGFISPSMKKIASSEELFMSMQDGNSSASSSSDEDEDRFRNRKPKMFHIWTSIDQDDEVQKKKKEIAAVGQFNIWSSLVMKKDGEENVAKVPEAPYVHPLVKKQSSSLKGKSLEVCTESLGSETGSELVEKREADVQQQQQVVEKKVTTTTQTVEHAEEFRVVKYNAAAAAAKKKSAAAARSFPPLITSLSGSDGALRIMTRRDNGRVILEAVSMPTSNNFRAQRQDGRLVLTFVSSPTPTSDNPEVVSEEQKDEDFEEKSVNFAESDTEDEDEDREEEEEAQEKVVIKERMDIEMEEAPKVVTSRVTSIHRLAVMMKKPTGLANTSHGWAADKFNQVVKYGGEDDENVEAVVKPTPLAQSFPPRPGCVARLIPKSLATVTATAANAASLNAYEYYWRTKQPTTAAYNNPLSQAPMKSSKNQMANQQLQLLSMRRNKGGDHMMIPLSNGCKEARRSLLIWEPYCIATS